MLFGRLLKQIRKRKGYTSQQLADALHVSRSTYSRYENDLKDVEPDILLGLANFYDTTVDDFLLWNALIKSPDYPMNVNKLRKLGKLKKFFDDHFFQFIHAVPGFCRNHDGVFFVCGKACVFVGFVINRYNRRVSNAQRREDVFHDFFLSFKVL